MEGFTNAVSKRQHYDSEDEEANKRRATTIGQHGQSNGMGYSRPSGERRTRSGLTYGVDESDDDDEVTDDDGLDELTDVSDEEAEKARLLALMAEARRKRDLKQQGQQRQEAQRQRQHQLLDLEQGHDLGNYYGPDAAHGHSQRPFDGSQSSLATSTVGANSGIPKSHPGYRTYAYTYAEDYDDLTLPPMPNEIIHGAGSLFQSQNRFGEVRNRHEQSRHNQAARGDERMQIPFATPGSGADMDTIRLGPTTRVPGQGLHTFAATNAQMPKTKSQQKKEQDDERGIVKGTDGKAKGIVRTENGILEVKIDHQWKPAAYHHERRKELLRIAESLCSYDVKPVKGHDPLDRIAPHPWYKAVNMKERSMRSYVLYLWDPPNDRRPAGSGETNGYMRDPYDDKKILIDMNNHPIRDFPELPAILTGQLDGTWIELFRRLNRNITLPDIFARTPPTTVKGVGTKRQALTIQSYGNRARRDRILLGTRAWQEREGSDGIADRLKQAMPNRVLEELESEGTTSSWRDLTNKEIDAITAINHCKGSAQSRAGNKALDPVTKKARDEVKNAKEGAAFSKLLEEKEEENEKDAVKQGRSSRTAKKQPRKRLPGVQRSTGRFGSRLPPAEDPADHYNNGDDQGDFSGIGDPHGEAAEGGWNDSTLLDDEPMAGGEVSGPKTMTDEATKEFEDFLNGL
ncbi:MAG: hypothetical protein Q9174_004893 [Haloplaca sp. 1 TL-2023]